MISGKINSAHGSHGGVSTGVGNWDHNKLLNRTIDDQHPISAITDLQEILDKKLDSETALPLIEEAVKNKAKGLYYDAMKELARKPYWYLTSEIDPLTKMGTKASIISGPYDLGQGGGGGGGGGGVTTVTIKGVEWPSVVVAGGTAKIQVFWSSVIGEEKTPTGNGTLYLKINNKQVAVKSNQPQGIVEFDISGVIMAGANSVQVQVMDTYGTVGVYVGNISGVTLELKSNFNYKTNYTGIVNYTYIPYGDVEKTVHIIVDGIEYTTQVVRSTGEQQTVQIIGLSHGAHTLKVYFTAVIDATEVTSNELFYDLIYYKAGNTTPIIASEFRSYEQEQYIAFNIPYRVYEYGKNLFTVVLSVNGVDKDPITVNTDEQYWDFRSDEPGIFNLQIKCGTTSKDFTITVKESTIDVKPVAQDLALELGTQGRTNAEPIEKRSKWEDVAHGISSELTNFNWSSDGWLKDTAGNTVLRVTGDARVKIPYKVFENDFKNSGKTIELELATSTVRNYETVIMSCLDKNKSDFFESKVNLVETDVRKKGFSVKLDNKVFKEKVVELGKYQFFYNNGIWKYNDTEVNIAEYGVQLIEKKIDPEAKATDPYLLNGDSFTITYSLSARGFYLTPQIAVFKSQQTSLSTQYKEDDHVRLAFVVEKNSDNRIIWMYINGIASGAIQYPTDDSFRHLDPNAIEIGTNDATIDIYNIRVYDNNLTSKQVVNNWVADTQDAAVKAKRYYHNQNYNDKNQITIEAMKASCPDLPQIIWDIDPLPQYKGDKRKGNAYYTDYSDSSRNFTGINGDYNVQGTSSSVYPTKNIRLNMKKATEWYDDNGNTIKSFKIGEDDLGANYFTYKVDFASSEGANNVELTKLYNDASKKLGILNPAQIQDNHIRVGINGYPIVAFHRSADGVDTFCTKANFNNDKANENVYGFADGDESWEITNNSADEGNFKKAVTAETFGNAFEIRYPDIDGYSDLTKLKPMTEWVVSTDPTQATDIELAEKVQFKYKHMVRAKDGSYKEIEVTMPSEDTYYTHDTAEYRKTKFRAELKNWFNVDSTIFYYIFTHLFLMIDSRAKNAFPTYFKSRQEGDGGDRWFWLPYDMDTAIGINNEGKLVFDYNLEDVDKQDGANVFNGQNSVMWCNVRETFDGEIGAMYAEMRKVGNLISFDEVEDRFTVHQGKWSENLFNEDAHNKYVVPLAKGDNYLEMLQGSKAEQRRWWLYNRFKYFDSKYLAGDAKADFIQFRAYAKSDVVITPYADIYACVSYANTAGAVVSKRAERGKSYIMENPLPASASDQETYIYSASQLKSIGDLSGFFPDTVKVGNAVKLQELKVGDAATTYKNTHLTELTLGSNTLLRTLDVRNCSALTKAIDVSGCTNIEEIYFDGTKITGINLPDGGILKKLHLPNTITKLTLKNQPLLNELVLAGTENIESLWLENIPSSSINAYELLVKMKTAAEVRLIGINEDYRSDVSGYSKALALFDRLDVMKGLDGSGGSVDKAQVQGKIYLQTISYADLQTLLYKDGVRRYPEVEVIVEQVICRVTFWNEEIIFSSQNILLGHDAADPGIPTKESTQSHDYTFSKWDKSYTNVQTDLDIKAIYTESLRKYTAIFNTKSPIIHVEPESETKEFGSLLDEPAVKDIPEHVTLVGWFRPDDTEWHFDTDILLDNIELSAKWQDDDKPVLTVERKAFDTFSFECYDNVGITGWALTQSEITPTSWNIIPAVTPYIGEKQISGAGDWYFWVRDEYGNTASSKLVAHTINCTAAAGIIEFGLYENSRVASLFALDGTIGKINAVVDEHYENLILMCEGAEVEPDTEIPVLTEINLSATCTPKSYTVTFNTVEKGTAIDPQTIVYLNKAERPLDQYYKGEIISDWYIDSEYAKKWDFETDVVTGDIELFAKWVAHRTPTILTIDVPDKFVWNEVRDEENYRFNDREIVVCYSQHAAKAVTIDWGDGSDLFKSDNIGTVIWASHTYDIAGIYNVKILNSSDAEYFLGNNFEYGILNPTEYITKVDFAWDITKLTHAGLRWSSITESCLTSYMTIVESSAFLNCRKLKTITIPDSVVSIGSSAFAACILADNEVILSKNLHTMANNAFESCAKLPKVIFNSAIDEIADMTFYGCLSLTEIKLPESINSIGHSAFYECISLKELIVPESTLSIGISAFAYSGIEKLIIKSKNCKIYKNAFNGFGIISGKPATIGPITNDDGTPGDYTIMYSWETEIPDEAFYSQLNATNIKSVTLSKTILKIGELAFANLPLTTAILSNELQIIGAYAFTSTKLVNIDIPFSVILIGDAAFADCTSLRWVKIHCPSVESKISSIEQAWFINTESKEEVTTEMIIYINDSAYANPIANYGRYWNLYWTDGETKENYISYKKLSEAPVSVRKSIQLW